MLLGGLWHGAAWTFVVWGGIHGIGARGRALAARTDRGYVARAETAAATWRRAPDHLQHRLPRLDLLPVRLASPARGTCSTGLVHALGPAVAARHGRRARSRSWSGSASQYLPARVPQLIDGALLAACRSSGRLSCSALALMLDERDGPGGRRTLHLLPLLMAIRTAISSRARASTRSRTVERAAGAAPLDRRRPRTDAGASTAGHALVVALLALVFGLLLDAPGLHKSAFNQPAGRQRDVALALTGPLAGVEPRAAPRPAADVASRTRSAARTTTTIDTRDRRAADRRRRRRRASPRRRQTGAAGGARPKPAEAEGRVHAEAEAPPLDRRRLARDHAGLRDRAGGRRAARRSSRSAASTGTSPPGSTRPDVFNWFHEIRHELKALHPNVVVLNFGANDDHGYMTGLPDGRHDRRLRRPRLGARVRAPRRRGDGHCQPRRRVRRLDRPADHARPRRRRSASTRSTPSSSRRPRKRPGEAAFIDTYTLFAGDDGGFAEYLTNPTGDIVKVRAAGRRALRARRAATSSRARC